MSTPDFTTPAYLPLAKADYNDELETAGTSGLKAGHFTNLMDVYGQSNIVAAMNARIAKFVAANGIVNGTDGEQIGVGAATAIITAQVHGSTLTSGGVITLTEAVSTAVVVGQLVFYNSGTSLALIGAVTAKAGSTVTVTNASTSNAPLGAILEFFSNPVASASVLFTNTLANYLIYGKMPTSIAVQLSLLDVLKYVMQSGYGSAWNNFVQTLVSYTAITSIKYNSIITYSATAGQSTIVFEIAATGSTTLSLTANTDIEIKSADLLTTAISVPVAPSDLPSLSFTAELALIATTGFACNVSTWTSNVITINSGYPSLGFPDNSTFTIGSTTYTLTKDTNNGITTYTTNATGTIPSSGVIYIKPFVITGYTITSGIITAIPTMTSQLLQLHKYTVVKAYNACNNQSSITFGYLTSAISTQNNGTSSLSTFITKQVVGQIGNSDIPAVYTVLKTQTINDLWISYANNYLSDAGTGNSLSTTGYSLPEGKLADLARIMGWDNYGKENIFAIYANKGTTAGTDKLYTALNSLENITSGMDTIFYTATVSFPTSYLPTMSASNKLIQNYFYWKNLTKVISTFSNATDTQNYLTVYGLVMPADTTSTFNSLTTTYTTMVQSSTAYITNAADVTMVTTALYNIAKQLVPGKTDEVYYGYVINWTGKTPSPNPAVAWSTLSSLQKAQIAVALLLKNVIGISNNIPILQSMVKVVTNENGVRMLYGYNSLIVDANIDTSVIDKVVSMSSLRGPDILSTFISASAYPYVYLRAAVSSLTNNKFSIDAAVLAGDLTIGRDLFLLMSYYNNSFGFLNTIQSAIADVSCNYILSLNGDDVEPLYATTGNLYEMFIVSSSLTAAQLAGYTFLAVIFSAIAKLDTTNNAVPDFSQGRSSAFARALVSLTNSNFNAFITNSVNTTSPTNPFNQMVCDLYQTAKLDKYIPLLASNSAVSGAFQYIINNLAVDHGTSGSNICLNTPLTANYAILTSAVSFNITRFVAMFKLMPSYTLSDIVTCVSTGQFSTIIPVQLAAGTNMTLTQDEYNNLINAGVSQTDILNAVWSNYPVNGYTVSTIPVLTVFVQRDATGNPVFAST